MFLKPKVKPNIELYEEIGIACGLVDIAEKTEVQARWYDTKGSSEACW